jgi:TonB family protein
MLRALVFGLLIGGVSCNVQSSKEMPVASRVVPEISPSDPLAVNDTAVARTEIKSAEVLLIKDKETLNVPFRGIHQVLEESDDTGTLKFKIDPGRNTVLQLPQGTKITIPRQVFVNANDDLVVTEPVTVSIKEYYSLSDMITGNLTTTTASEVLETGGMLYINAKTNAAEIKLDESKGIDINFAVSRSKKGMQLFNGDRNESGTMMWKTAGENEPTIVEIGEEMPQFPGGYEKLIKYLSKNLKYPAEARRKGIEGNVYVGMTIDENGRAGDFTVLKTRDNRLNQAAVNAFASMPNWKPGTNNGRFVKVRIAIPVKFTLDAAKSTGLSTNDGSPPGDLEPFQSDPNLLIDDKIDSADYVFQTSRLGWINCDRFIRNNVTGKYKVYIGSGNEMDVKLVFKKYKSILPGYGSNGFANFDNVALNETVTIIAMYNSEKGLMLATITAITGNRVDSVQSFRPVTIQQLKQELKKLE